MESIVAKLDAALYPAVCSVNTYLSNYILVFLLVAVGLWYSIKTRFIQVRCFGEGMRRVFGNLTLNGKKHTHRRCPPFENAPRRAISRALGFLHLFCRECVPC